jgi:hypothetical protein
MPDLIPQLEHKLKPQIETAIKLALKKMFSDSHFSICTIDSCLKLIGIVPDKDIYQIMQTVHCVQYKEMDNDFRQWLIEQSIFMCFKDKVEILI